MRYLTKTIWKRIPGFASWYRISNFGEIKSLAHTSSKGRFIEKRELSPRPDKEGYLCINLYTKLGKQVIGRIHRLQLLAFVGPPKSGEECRHLDGDPSNNIWSSHKNENNLVWSSHKKNMDDKKKHGTIAKGSSHGMSKLSEKKVKKILALLRRGVSRKEIADQFGVHKTVIAHIAQNRIWRHVKRP